MSVVVNFGGKSIIEPGVYAQTKSGVPAKPNVSPFGNVVIIDTGSGSGWGGGSGINGEDKRGLDSVYSFDDPNDFRSFVGGGQIFDYSEYIFNPLIGAPAPEQVSVVRAAQTVAAKINITHPNVSNLQIAAKHEGSVGNGYLREKRAVAVLKVDPASADATGNITLEVQNDDTTENVEIFSFENTFNSFVQLQAKIIDEINTSTAGNFSAEKRGTDIIVFSDRGQVEDYNGTNNQKQLKPADNLTLIGDPTVDFVGGELYDELINGFAVKFDYGEEDETKLVAKFYQGTFGGYTEAGIVIDSDEENSKPLLLATSIEFGTFDELINWALTNPNFNKVLRVVDNYSLTNQGAISEVEADALVDAGFVLASGGSEDYRAEDLDRVLEDLREFGNTFFLADKFGDEARSVENLKILDHILNDAEFEKFLVIGGGIDENKFKDGENSSVEIAKFYDSHRVIVVHSGNERTDKETGKVERLPAIYHAANVVGRLGGLEPQEPLTFKNLRITNFLHVLGFKERKLALQSGVLHNRVVADLGNVVNQGVNSLQKNTQQINPNGTSFEISINSVSAQINKELVLNSRPLFIGSNRGKVTPADVKSFVEGYLLSRTVQDNEDNLIIEFKNVTVKLQDGDFYVTYSYVANGPINKMFLTGFLLDGNL